MVEASGHLYIVTHTDLDGVGSAAAAVVAFSRADGEYTVLYAEPYNIHEKIEEIQEYIDRGDTMVIADLGPNKDSFPRAVEIITKLVERGARVYWFDHHVWDESEREAVEKAGAKLVVDRSTCATGVVASYAPRLTGVEKPGFFDDLARAVCAADLWRWDHPLAPKLYRVVEARATGVPADEWRNRIVAKFAEGNLWDEELEAVLEQYVNRELANYNNILRTVVVVEADCRVAAAYKERGPPANSFVAASLLSRYQADIAVIVRENGGLSLRSRNVNVRDVAVRLGGGGHPVAAGAKIRIPITIRLAMKLSRKMLSRHAARVVLKAAEDAGVCRGPRG